MTVEFDTHGVNSRTLAVHKGKYKWEVMERVRPVGRAMYLATRHGGRSKPSRFPRIFLTRQEVLDNYPSVASILKRHLEQEWTGLREIWVSPEGVERLL